MSEQDQSQVTEAEATTARSVGPAFDFVIDVPLELSVEVGGARLLVREVLQLKEGSVIELDRSANDPAEVFVNGKLIAKGEVSVVEDRLVVQISEIVGEQRGKADSGSE
ncbi:MAG: flagellar motor switch protein FliN [Myxococcales bacterium]|nr:flagellar motor switch protein FliN [Myxococcales bacterium]